MKKISIVLFSMLAASQVFAQTAVCTNGTAAAVTPATPTAFVVRGFNAKCSANVDATYLENSVAFAVGALSRKGKSFFQGNTGGGAVSGQVCPGVTCQSGDQNSGLQAALNAAT